MGAVLNKSSVTVASHLSTAAAPNGDRPTYCNVWEIFITKLTVETASNKHLSYHKHMTSFFRSHHPPSIALPEYMGGITARWRRICEDEIDFILKRVAHTNIRQLEFEGNTVRHVPTGTGSVLGRVKTRPVSSLFSMGITSLTISPTVPSVNGNHWRQQMATARVWTVDSRKGIGSYQ
ncbi:hypothetical protein P692DRAFT_201810431 [Suillus brevipes Sb2]|nr:hypothetical protein P692DRAFT_201810431 [Suillus brevipes Sb2]